MDSKKRQALIGFLSQLPEDKVIALSAAVERARVAGDEGLPHDVILEGLRPVLSAAAYPPARVVTPLRLFCQVFEDMLQTGSVARKRRGRIDRASVAPLWDWLATDLIPDVHASLCTDLRAQILEGDHKRQSDTLAQLHEAAAEAMADALKGVEPGTKAYRQISERLGSARALEDARDVMLVLMAAPQLMQVRQLFPKPITQVSESDLAAIRRYYEFLSRHMPHSMPSVFYLLMGRMRDQALILKVGASLAAADGAKSLSRSKLAFLGNLLLNELESLADYIRALQALDSDADGLLAAIEAFVALVRGLDQQIDAEADAPWAEAVSAARVTVGEAVDDLLRPVPATIADALPATGFGAYAGAPVPQCAIATWPDAEAVGRAMTAANFLAATRSLAADAGFADSHGRVEAEAAHYLEHYGEALVAALDGADPESRKRADAYLEAATRMTSFVMSDQDAALLWEKGVGAAA